MSSGYQPFIIVPPLTTCQTSYIVLGDGTPPYKIYPIASGSGNATSLEQIPPIQNAGAFAWRVDFNEGANLTWVVVDAENEVGYSEFRVVRSQARTGVTTCSKNTYSTSHSGRDGAIGGAVGGVVLLLCIGIVYLVYRRYEKQRRLAQEFAGLPQARESTETVEMANRSNDLVRRGTFNLHHVQFNEDTHPDAPPSYVPPTPKRRFGAFRGSRPTSHASSAQDLNVVAANEEQEAEATTSTMVSPDSPELGRQAAFGEDDTAVNDPTRTETTTPAGSSRGHG